MAKKRIIVVGTNHAGTSFLRTIRQLEKNAEVVTYDRNNNISFLGCGIALWVGGEFQEPDGLFYATPKTLKDMGVEVNMEHDVIKVDPKAKTLMVKNLKTGEEFEDKYDKLVFASGSWPITPPFEGVDLEGIYISKIFQHAQAIKRAADDESVKNVVVVGGGYIGIELVEAFHKKGKNVTLIDMEDRCVPRYFDHEFTNVMEERIRKDGVTVSLGNKVQKFEGKNGKVTKVVTEKGSFETDIVIMSIGFIPNTQLLKDHVKTIRNGAIIVDEFNRSSNKDIYAIGDCSAIKQNVLGDNMHVALATNAVKTGIVAAFHTAGKPVPFPGVQGTNGINVFGCKFASTGFSEESCKMLGIKAKAVFFKDNDRPEFMKKYDEVQIKVTYDPESLRILGAQIGSWGEENHTEAIIALSVMIAKKMTMIDLSLTDYFFLPHFNKPFNYILQTGLKALGLKY